MPNRVAWTCGLVQLCFTLSWTVYVIFLPALAQRVGLGTSVPALLMADQALFAICDLWAGARTDSAVSALTRAGRVLVIAVVVSSVAFALLPATSSRGLFLAAVIVWVVASSALRVPPLALLGRYAGPKGATRAAAAYAVGIGVAASAAPYMTMKLKERSPVLPFMLASIAVVLSTLALVWAFRSVPSNEDSETSTDAAPSRTQAVFVLAAVACAAIAFQIHFPLRSAGLFAKLAGATAIPKLMPVFWIGFNLALYPVTRLLAKRAPATVMAGAALLGAIGTVLVERTHTIPIVVIAQAAAGAAWGATFLAGLGACAGYGHVGKEGRYFGRFFAILAAATFGRMALFASGLTKLETGVVATLLPVAACVSWVVAASVLQYGIRRTPLLQ
jgi:MFS family permease